MSLSEVTLSNIFECVKIYDKLAINERKIILEHHANFPLAYFALKGIYLEEINNCEEIVLNEINGSYGYTETNKDQVICPVLDFRNPDDNFGHYGEVVYDIQSGKFFKFGHGYLEYKESLNYTTIGGHVQQDDEIEPMIQNDIEDVNNLECNDNVAVFRTIDDSMYQPVSPDYAPTDVLEETGSEELPAIKEDVVEVRRFVVQPEKFMDIVDKMGRRYKNAPQFKEYNKDILIKYRHDARNFIITRRRRKDVASTFDIKKIEVDKTCKRGYLVFSQEKEWFVVSEDASLFTKKDKILGKIGIDSHRVSKFYIDGIFGLHEEKKENIDVIKILDVKRHYGEYYSRAPPLDMSDESGGEKEDL